jgi:hypothetical protein
VVLQVTPLAGSAMNGQSRDDVQTWLLPEQVPVSGQLALVRHDAPPTAQVPGTVGQLALDVHTVLLWTLQ